MLLTTEPRDTKVAAFDMQSSMEGTVSKKLQMSCTTDARSMLCTVAGPRGWNDTRQSWLARAARRLGWSYPRTFNVFYGRARVIRAEEWLRLEAELSALRQSAQTRQGAINELEILARSHVSETGGNAGPVGVAGDASGAARPRAKRHPRG